MKFAGLDIGTSTIGSILIDSDRPGVIETHTLPNKSLQKTDRTWENIQDPESIWETCRALLVNLVKDHPAVNGIGLAGQMHGILYVDDDGKAVSPLFTWQDGRGNLPYSGSASYAEYLADALGYSMASGFGLTTHFYNLQNKIAPEKGTAICSIADYVAMRLCGSKTPRMHASHAASLGAFDLHRMQFDTTALEKAGIDAGILPESVSSEVVLGETSEGIPVCIAIGDNQASFLGAVDSKSNVLVNIGTSSQISIKSKELAFIKGLETRPFIKGEFLLVGAGLCGGSAYALLKDLLKEALVLYGFNPPDDMYVRMGEAAQSEYGGNDHLVVDTRFRGTRADPSIRGSISNISINNLSIGHLASSVLQGICSELFDFYTAIPNDMKQGKSLVGSGNALRRNPVLRQILSDTFEKEVLIPQYEEEAALGAAILSASTVNRNISFHKLQQIITD